jgi:hypothetical protein
MFDMTISKFNTTGSTMLYSTYLGGNNDDRPYSMVVNSNDELYILGSTNSNNFPMRGGGYDNTANGNWMISLL